MDSTLLEQVQDEAQAHVDARREATISVGLSVGGERFVGCFRTAGATLASMPTASTVYEMGSVSKTFSNTLLAVLVERGVLDLDAPISTYLPTLALPAPVAAITLRRLATHSAGLPSTGARHQRLIMEEFRGSLPPYGTYTHYLRYRREDLYADLESMELAYPTGEGWTYSIIGMGTLGHICEVVTGTPYEELLLAEVCRPLGLEDTAYTLSDDQRFRMQYAFDGDGQPLPNWYHDVLMSQGGLRTTPDDLLTWLEANLAASAGDGASELDRALRLTRTVHGAAPEGTPLPLTGEIADFTQGLGWRGLAREGGQAWFHPGATMFYLTYAGLDPDAGVACAILSSDQRSLATLDAVEVLGRRWLAAATAGALAATS